MFLALALAAILQQGEFRTDTTVAAAPGGRLHVENMGGSITIRAWDRNQVRVRASHTRRTIVSVHTTAGDVNIEGEGRAGGPAYMVDYEISAPAGMSVDLEGMGSDMTVEGLTGAVKIETVEGEVRVTGAARSVDVESVSGSVRVEGARGRVKMHAVSEDITGIDLAGDITAESVSGDIALLRIDSRSVDAQTVSGEVRYGGTFKDGGQYGFATHSGDVSLGVPEGTNASVSVSGADSDISASFPIATVDRRGRRRQQVNIGGVSGTGTFATVEVETYSGDVRFMRPAELKAAVDARMRREKEKEKDSDKDNDNDAREENR